MPKRVVTVWRSNSMLENPVFVTQTSGVLPGQCGPTLTSHPRGWGRVKLVIQTKIPHASKGSIPPPLGTLQHVARLKCSVFKNSGYWENNSSSWNLTQLGGTSFQTAPEWKEKRGNYQNHVKLIFQLLWMKAVCPQGVYCSAKERNGRFVKRETSISLLTLP